MAGRRVARGEIWMYRFAPPDKRRPVVVLSRPALIEVLQTITVAAITGARRGSPTEVPVGIEEGLKKPSCINLVNVFTIRQAELRRLVGVLSADKMRDVCRALVVACGCD